MSSDVLTEEELRAVWQRVQRSRDAKHRRKFVALALASAVVGALAVFLLWPRPPLELHQQGGLAFVRVESGETVRLGDGSEVRAAVGARLEVLESSATRVSLHLQRGSARFSVAKGTGRQWRIEAGEVSVEVVGTVFSVSREAVGTRVEVEEGVVVVRGARVPDGVRRLGAGESLVVGGAVSEAPAVVAPSPPPPPSPVPPPRAAQKPAVVAASTAAPVEAPAPSPSPVPPSAAELMVRADVARRTGDLGSALTLLGRVVTEWPDGPEAPLAAFTRANLLADAGRHDDARAWYRRSLELGLREPLATSARAALEAER